MTRIQKLNEWKKTFNTQFRHCESLKLTWYSLGHVQVCVFVPWHHSSRLFFQHLWEKKLYVKADNCEFYSSAVSFSGFIISKGQLPTEPLKKKAVVVLFSCKLLKHFQESLSQVASFQPDPPPSSFILCLDSGHWRQLQQVQRAVHVSTHPKSLWSLIASHCWSGHVSSKVVPLLKGGVTDWNKHPFVVWTHHKKHYYLHSACWQESDVLITLPLRGSCSSNHTVLVPGTSNQTCLINQRESQEHIVPPSCPSATV